MTGLLRVPFFSNELFTSHLSRTARANGTWKMRAFCLDLGIKFDSVVCGDAEQISKFSALLSYSETDLISRSVRAISGGRVAIGGASFPSWALSTAAIRFCPNCLDEDELDAARMPGVRRYARVQWAFQCIRTCHRHERLLVPLALTGADPNPNDFCAVLDTAHITAAKPRVFCAPSDFELFVIDRLDGQGGKGGLLDTFALPDCIDLCELFGMAALKGRRFSPKNRDEAFMSTAADVGFLVLKEGESGVHRELNELARSANRRRARGTSLYGSLYELLERRPSTYDPIKRIVREHSVELLPHLSGTNVFGETTGERWMTIAAIASASGASAELVSLYLRQHGHIQMVRKRPHSVEISPAIARAAIKVLKDAVTFNEVRAILGCTAEELQSLVLANAVKPIVGEPHEHRPRSLMDRFSRAEVEKLRDHVIEGARANVDLEGLVFLRVAIRRTGCNPADAFSLITERRLALMSCDPKRSLFAGVKVEFRELEEKLVSRGYVNCGAAENIVGIPEANPDRSIRTGGRRPFKPLSVRPNFFIRKAHTENAEPVTPFAQTSSQSNDSWSAKT